MSSVNLRSVSGGPRRTIVVIGWLIAAISVFHLVMLTFFGARVIPGWVDGALRGAEAEDFASMTVSEGYFWSSLGGFAFPLFALGLLIVWLARAGVAPPVFVYLVLLAWSVPGTLVFFPGGYLALIPMTVILLVADAKSRKLTTAQVSARTAASR
ncbi:hypothetical protein Snas_5563 [Stackebrandtia nassauensis DSM 44728]|uniref:Uncharacterized protein n=1 Tax=Stackebrandtia nassauensis (strain DSM 44728 / CIP 108903 / NRRL B-16338 / NBRC 102104 / LLR-40K-21) TaxID=446470 RepID=D3PWX0_STANL|nr:hypothetical protein Snas_5563 [Stackebrandtia nassauensis DSM 44728]